MIDLRTHHEDSTQDASSITILDLFAGAGGLSQGIKQGLPEVATVAAIEMDPRAAKSYSLNHGIEAYAGPIQDWLSERKATGQVPHATIVVGGPPCQGFSTLGKQNAEDARNSLWREYAETVRLARPKYFVLENVPAFLKSPQYEIFKKMTDPGEPLQEYTFNAKVLNAAEFGAPQIRKRVIVLGSRKDVPTLIHPTIMLSDSSKWQTVRDTIGGLGSVRPLPQKDGVEISGRSVAGPFRADELHVTRNYTDLSLKRFRKIPLNGNRFDLPEKLKAPCWVKHKSGSADVMGRLNWEKPSVTIRTEFVKPEKGRYLHPDQHRAITPYEGALLQGFPEDYLFVGSMTDIVRQIGNAVPIPLGAAIGRQLALTLRLDSQA